MSVDLGHDEAWHQNRLTGLGGSDATTIMGGNEERILRLWKEKRGESEREDLSNILAVQMGSFTEALNVHWFERQTGLSVSTDTRECRHPEYSFMRCELDGRIDADTLLECKHTGAYAKGQEVVERYFWQCQHQMACAGASLTYLSVFFGNSRWESFQVARDDGAINTLIPAEAAFWQCVKDGTAPVAVEVKVDISLDDMIEVDVTQAPCANEFASMAGLWLETKGFAKSHKEADKRLKDTMEDNVKRLHGYGVEVLRGSNGARRIKEIRA